MKKILIAFVLIWTQLQVSALCVDGNKDVTTHRIELDEFTQISVRTAAKIFLYQGDEQKVDIIAESNLIDLLKTDVKDKEWAIAFSKCIRATKEIEIHITMVNIEGIELNASNDIVTSELIKSDKLDLEINGSGDLDLNLEVNKLKTEINGAGDIKFKGKAVEHDINIRGAGDIKAYDLQSDKVDINIKGAGDVNTSVAKELNVKIYGAGDVGYRGNPAKVDVSKYGAGDVRNTGS